MKELKYSCFLKGVHHLCSAVLCEGSYFKLIRTSVFVRRISTALFVCHALDVGTVRGFCTQVETHLYTM
jgi:hypothetical protein